MLGSATASHAEPARRSSRLGDPDSFERPRARRAEVRTARHRRARLRNRVAQLGVGLALAGTFGAGQALAATRTTTFTVTLTLQSDCQIQATNLNFGSSGIIASNIDATSVLTLTCTQGTPYSVALGPGTTPGSSVVARLLQTSDVPANVVLFQLYQDAARTAIWGDTTGINTIAGTGNGTPQPLTVYGRVPVPNAPPPAGTYTSTITATVSF